MAKKILIVDDDKISRSTLAKKLKKKGFKTVELEDGEACISYLLGDTADLILLDIIMPGISGIGVLKSIRQRYSPFELPIIMVTSVTEEENTIEALDLGANDYITKPANINIALSRIRSQLKLTDLYKKSLSLREVESINAMIVTYNHEINTPLCLVMAIISEQSEDNKELQKAKNSIDKISSILRKIHEITEDKINYTQYGNHNKMVKLKDEDG
ncbi:hypothetical protein A9Q84_11385 [Halobacteriovorax marinus]|uniref:Response regulatory domain-containing protein n=1 Tax=Halobacteriovorax marinus TaxID=97084 RepID=A0A1Y5FBV1_9BACT|nr:hypothetical protein A9Q84_11385 [Halobacteriovorax marinus]